MNACLFCWLMVPKSIKPIGLVSVEYAASLISGMQLVLELMLKECVVTFIASAV